jgi:serine/threonine protein phosphatase 1
MNRRLFIGAVHGQYNALLRLWDLISPGSGDSVYFVGDLIDRGPKSAQVVSFVRQHGAGCVLGNHEQLFLDAFSAEDVNVLALQEWLRSGGQATIDSYREISKDLKEDLEWMRGLPLYIDLENVWLVHAGLNPNLPLARQSSHEFCWIRRLFHYSNAPYFPDKQIITGHTMTFTFPNNVVGQIAEGAGWCDIDTGAYDPRGGWLTALDWENQTVYQVDVFGSEQKVQTYAESVFCIEPNLAETPRRKRSAGKKEWKQKIFSLGKRFKSIYNYS